MRAQTLLFCLLGGMLTTSAKVAAQSCGLIGQPCCTTGTACREFPSICDVGGCVHCGNRGELCCSTGSPCLATNVCQSGRCDAPGGAGGMAGGGGAGGSSGSGGSSNGDPHLLSGDGLAFDFQGVGEFVLSQSGSMLVQVRQEQWANTPASVQTAVAVESDGDRVGVYVACSDAAPPKPVLETVLPKPISSSAAVASLSCSARLRVNGAEAALGEGAMQVLPGGARLNRAEDGYELSSADGLSRVDIDVHAGFLNARLASGASSNVGLLRGENGDPRDDIATRAGQVLAQPITFRDFYDLYGESWRVDAGESLFDYAPGQSSETFQDRSFPPFRMSLSYLPANVRSAATTTCTAAGVAAGYWLDSCALDVALTGDARFAQGFPRQSKVVSELVLLDDSASATRRAQWLRGVAGQPSTASCQCDLRSGSANPTAWWAGLVGLGLLLGRRAFACTVRRAVANRVPRC